MKAAKTITRLTRLTRLTHLPHLRYLTRLTRLTRMSRREALSVGSVERGSVECERGAWSVERRCLYCVWRGGGRWF